jgi:hypothetical protein
MRDDDDDDDTGPPPLLDSSHKTVLQEVDELNDFIRGTYNNAAAAPPPSPSLPRSNKSLLQQADDHDLNLRCRPWKGVLPFSVNRTSMGDKSVVGPFTTRDLFALVAQIYKGTIARFDPLHYPAVNRVFKANAKVWGQLSSDLTAALKEHGNCL